MSLDQFLAAIRDQESGGDYGITNPIGAMGAYQIMPSHLNDWIPAVLGHNITEAEFLSHPAEQDAVAAAELGPIYNSQGPAAAAAWWYSGQTDPTKTFGNPPVYQYVQDVLAKIGSAGSVTPADNVSGSTVTTAGLQQVGYDAVINLTPWGIPLNPFKLPGWLAGKLGSAAGSAGKAAGGAMAQGMWDAVGPMVLATLGVGAGLALIVLGVYVTAKPALDRAESSAATIATAAAL